MKRTLSLFALVLLMSLGLAASNSFASGTPGKAGFMMMNSSNLVGAPVRDSHGELVGIVNGVIIDSAGYAFALINHGDYDLAGESGINTPVPFQELQIFRAKGGQDSVVLKTDMEHLDFAPYFDPLKRATRHDEANIYEYYGIEPNWTEAGAATTTGKGRFMELNSFDLTGAAVENSCGKVEGIVNEIMVDSAGHAFAVINHGDYDLYGDSGVNTPVPIQELRILKPEGGQYTVVLKTDMEHLDLAPYLSPLTKLNRQYEANLFEYYGIQPSWTD